MYKWFKNEQGMTLVELLAAISLLAIFLAIVSSVIMQLGKSGNLTAGKMTLVEDTNVLINELRHQYDDQSNSQLCFDEDSKRLTIKNYSIINGSGASEHSLLLKNGCVENVDKKLPLSIDLTTESSNGQTFSIQTAWEQHDSKSLSLTVVEGDEEDDGDDISKPEGDLIYSNRGHYTKIGCTRTYNGNTLFDIDVKKNGACTVVIEGNALFDYAITIHQGIDINVANNVYINNRITLNSSASITAGDNVFIDNAVTLKSGAHIIATNPHSKVVFNGPVTLHNHSRITIHGDAHFNQDIVQQGNNGSICVKGNKTIDEQKEKKYSHIFKCP